MVSVLSLKTALVHLIIGKGFLSLSYLAENNLHVLREFAVYCICLQCVRFKDSVGLQMIPRCTAKQIRSDCPQSAKRFGKLKKSPKHSSWAFFSLVPNFIENIQKLKYYALQLGSVWLI